MTIAPEENCPPPPPNPKTNPKPNPNPNRWAIFLMGGLSGCPPNPKTNPDLDPNPNPNQGGDFPWGAIVRIPHKTIFSSFNIKSYSIVK